MTHLLVSVRSAEEARAALEGGVDWIDVKEPSRGSLGAADSDTIAAIVREIAGRKPVSVALGELIDWRGNLLDWSGVAAVKLGLAGCGNRRDWQAELEKIWSAVPDHVMRVAVAYADWQLAAAPPLEKVVEFAERSHCGALLIDTWNKSAGALPSHLRADELARIVARVKQAGMLAVVAGSLDRGSLPAARRARPDYIAVRGAVCRGSRSGPLDRGLVREWRELVHGGGANGDHNASPEESVAAEA